MSASKSTKPITIMLVDDHHCVRSGVRLMLERESDMTVVAEAGNGREALEKYPIHKPSIVVMDISMPVMGGIPASQRLMRMQPPPKIVALSMCEAPDLLSSIMRAGARVYVQKRCKPRELTEAIRKVYHTTDFVCTKSNLSHVNAPLCAALAPRHALCHSTALLRDFGRKNQEKPNRQL